MKKETRNIFHTSYLSMFQSKAAEGRMASLFDIVPITLAEEDPAPRTQDKQDTMIVPPSYFPNKSDRTHLSTSSSTAEDAPRDMNNDDASKLEEGLTRLPVPSIRSNANSPDGAESSVSRDGSSRRRNSNSHQTRRPRLPRFLIHWKRPSAISMGRVLFVSFLSLVAATLGLGAYLFQNHAEESLAESQFEAIVDRAIDSARDITNRKMLGAITLTSIYSNSFPNPEEWPFVTLNGFDQVGRNMVATSRGRGVAFAPLVKPEQVEAFEDFAYEHFEPGDGESSFGRGIFAFDTTLDNTDKRYHDTTGPLFPILQALGPGRDKPILYMLNYHSIATRGDAMDTSLACASARPTNRPTSTDFGSAYCGTLTDITPPLLQEEPGAVIMLPVFPANNVSDVVAFIGSSILWGDVLEKAFNNKVSGIDVVLQTSASPDVAYTYRVVQGEAQYRGSTDMHDPAYEKYRRMTILTEVLDHEHLSKDSPVYSMMIYPSEDFFVVYSTSNPAAAATGAVVIIFFTSLLFLIYDALVIKENQKNQAIIEGRRRFMRFVSHEVRTPLNSVNMGLKLLREELATLFSGSIDPRLDASIPVIDTLCTQEGDGCENDLVVRVKKEQAQDILNLSTQILGSANNAIDVLSDVLNYDKIETGQLQLEKSVLDMCSLVDSVMHEFDMPFQTKGIQLVLLRSKTRFTEKRVIGDAMKITQVFRNILSNALKFTPEGGTVTVQPSWVQELVDKPNKSRESSFTLAACEDKVTFSRCGFLEVSISDTGVGMSEDQVSRLFRAGVQYNSNRLQAGQGSGLGLYIARGIMKRHDGDLTAASGGLAQGTTFTMTIPVYYIPDGHPILCHEQEEHTDPSEHKNGVARASAAPIQQKAPPTRSLRVLVVDDAMTNRKLLSKLLERHGHTCDQAEDGVQAIKKVTEALESGKPFESILLDYEMPIMDGPTAAQKMREMEGFDAFIVGITGNVLPEDVAYFKKCGVNDVLPKPLNLPALIKLWGEAGVFS